MAIRGLKSKIALNVGVLLLISAIITFLLVAAVMQSIWMRVEIQRYQTHITSMARLFLIDDVLNKAGSSPARWQKDLNVFTGEENIEALLILDRSEQMYFKIWKSDKQEQLVKNAAINALTQNKAMQINLDSHGNFFNMTPKQVLISMPVEPLATAHKGGAVAAVVHIDTFQSFINNSGKAILLYILINTTILTLAGLYRIFTIYLRPIDRIVRQADGYTEEEDPFFLFRKEDNELNRLSASLNRMLNRIATDKKKLQITVASLEKTNEELEQAQTEMVRAEKMAAIGRLAAGLAHEIGNPIGIVLGYLELLKDNRLSADEKKDYLVRAEKETLRINTIIRQLLDLARPKETALKEISVHDFLKEIVTVMKLQPLMKDIDIKLDCAAQNDRVHTNEEQIRQVLLNVILNAADAIHANTETKKRGKIHISTATSSGSPKTAGQTLVISVKDNGIGISSDQIDMIFDPFFTTKDPGKGTGLGLSVSYMITEQIGGAISARSDSQEGTTIDVHLPLTDNVT